MEAVAMNFHIRYLEFGLLYAGWLPILMYFFKKDISFYRDTILLMATQLLFSFLLLFQTKIFSEFEIKYLLMGVVLGGIAFVLELFIGRRKKNNMKKNTKLKISLFQFLVLLCIPIVEEIYFRAAILQWVMNRGIHQGNIGFIFILVSAFCVVINHFQCFKERTICVQKFLVEGILFSGVYFYSGTIWITLVAHIFFNVLNYVSFYDTKKSL